MADLPQQKLRELYVQYGRALCDDYQRCEGLLRDLCAPHMRDQSAAFKRQIHLLIEALKDGAPAELLARPAGVPLQARLASLTQRLRANTGLSQEAAQWAIDSWAVALGLVSAMQASDASLRVAPKPLSNSSSQGMAANSATGRPITPAVPDPGSAELYTRSTSPSGNSQRSSAADSSARGESAAGARTAAPKSINPALPNLHPPAPAGRKFAIPDWLIMVIAFAVAALAFSYIYLSHHVGTRRAAVSEPLPAPAAQAPADATGKAEVSGGLPSGSVVTRGVPPPPQLGSWRSGSAAAPNTGRDSAPPLGSH